MAYSSLKRFISTEGLEAEKSRLIETIRKINNSCIATYGHGVGKMLTVEDAEQLCELVRGDK